MGDGDGNQSVQLITFGKRESMATLERRREPNNTSAIDSWSQSPLYKNGSWESSPPEREPFLPVKLDPGWDSMAVNTSIKKSSTTQQLEELEKNPPPDRYNVVYIVMLLHGIAILIPWNMFINAKSYFENYKLQDSGNNTSEVLKDYRTNFMSYIGMASQFPNFIMNIINLFVQCGGNTLGVRVISGIIIMVIMFILTTVLAMIDSTEWPEIFFWITIGTAIIINSAVGIYQNSMYGLAATLPMKYTNAIIFGNNISGTLVAVTNIIVLVLSPDKKTSAIYYFVVAIVILMVAFDAYFVTGHTKFYRHYTLLSSLKEKEFKEKNASNNEPFYKILFRSFGRVFLQIYHLMFGVWFTFFITLLLFPAVMSDVQPLGFPLSPDFWTAIFCFLFFNLFATLGNLATEFIRWPNARWVNILVFLRIVFIPLMVLGNFRPDTRAMTVHIGNDYVFIVVSILFSFTSGYCSSLTMMYAPKLVATNDAPIAGMIMALCLVFGILCGINCSRLWEYVLQWEI
ncbi:equilibrative nucleoside transporter 1-like [Physella acuta]|uniref:equilibrative nucleoside transporter 1-like n=1 Tax=Physella acuta TaxID=109671 RepID=UPI0027DB3A2E|nr:equilibrative nucleoside transporter 1-like [Physella acuta]